MTETLMWYRYGHITILTLGIKSLDVLRHDVGLHTNREKQNKWNNAWYLRALVFTSGGVSIKVP